MYKSLFRLIFIIITLSFSINSQVIIKDTIKINPVTTAEQVDCGDYNLYVYSPLCPGEYAIFLIDQGDCYFNTSVKLRIVEGSEIASFYYFDNYQVIDLGDNIEVTVEGLGYYFYGLHLEEGIPTAAITVESNIDDVLDYATVYFVNDNATYMAILEPDIKILSPGEYLEFGAEIQGERCASIPYCQFNYNVKIIEGSEYGTLYYSETGEWGKELLNVPPVACNGAFFHFFADGEKPSDPVQVRIRVSLSDPFMLHEDFVLIIDPNLEPVVNINPRVLSPGGIASITIKRRNADGSLSSYYENATFEIGMLEGCVNGSILTNEGSGSYFYEVPQPIQFVAADSIEGDSGLVKLRVGVVWAGDDGSGGGATKSFTLDSTKAIAVNDIYESYNAARREKNSLTGLLADECYVGDYFTPVHWTGDMVIKNNYELEILEPLPNTIAWITPEPKMPEVTCKARLKGYDGEVTFMWEYWVSYELNRYDNIPPRSVCPRLGKIEITGTTTATNSEESNWLVPFTKSNLKFVNLQGKHFESEGGCEGIVSEWTEGNDVFMGGDVFIKVTALNISGKTIGFKQINAGVILGDNPKVDLVENTAGPNNFKAMIKHESKANQFNEKDNDKRYKLKYKDKIHYVSLPGSVYNKKGFPVYGIPNGYGLAQIDNSPAPTELDLWNWKHNLESGRERFESTFADNFKMVSKKFSDINTNKDIIEKISLMNTYQQYNSNQPYWLWDKKNRGWIDNPERRNNYGRTVYNIYIDLEN